MSKDTPSAPKLRNRLTKLEEAPITIQQKIAEWFARGLSAARIARNLDDSGYHISEDAIKKYIVKKNVQLTRMVFGTENIQAQVAKEYTDVVKNFADTSKSLVVEFNKIKTREMLFKNEYQRIQAMVEIGKLMRENVEFANKLLAQKVTTSFDSTDVMSTVKQLADEDPESFMPHVDEPVPLDDEELDNLSDGVDDETQATGIEQQLLLKLNKPVEELEMPVKIPELTQAKRGRGRPRKDPFDMSPKRTRKRSVKKTTKVRKPRVIKPRKIVETAAFIEQEEPKPSIVII